MARYQEELAPNVTILMPEERWGRPAVEALDALHRKGFVAGIGLTEQHLPDVYAMANERDIVEYCPKDRITRFAQNVVAAWHAKNGGSGYVSIFDVPENGGAPLYEEDIAALRDDQIKPVAYGWSRQEENKLLPGKDITTAYRVGAAGGELARTRRREHERFGLGQPIGELVLATGVVEFDADPKQISLETWKSNVKARGLYERMGFVRVPEADVAFDENGDPVVRPTLHPEGDIVEGHEVFRDDETGQNMVRDTRLNYYLANHYLLSVQ